MRPDVVVGFGGYVSVPGVPRRAATPGAARRPRGQRAARDREQARRPDDHPRRDQLPGHRAAPRDLPRAADPPDDLHPRPAGPPARGRERVRPRPRPADPAGHRRLPGGPPAQPGGGRVPSPPWRTPGSRCSTSPGPQGEVSVSDPGPATRRTSWCRSSTAWTSPTPPRTWSSAAAGANTVTEVAAVGLPAVFVPLPIGNGEQALNARPVVDAGGGLLVDDAALTSEWVGGTVPGAAPRPRPARRDVAGRVGLIPRDADEQLARMVLDAMRGAADERPGARRSSSPPTGSDGCTSSASAVPDSRGSPGSCWPAG